MGITKIVYLSFLCLIAVILTKRFSSELGIISSTIICIGITVFSISTIAPLIDYVKHLVSDKNYSSFCEILLKSAGVCLLCSFASEICRDMGESALASKIELAGKCTLITYSLPLIKSVFENATKLLS